MTVELSMNHEGNVRQKNKLLIFTAAKKEFVDHGFRGASIKRIAERAGLPRANIHYYFADKEDLYRQLLAEILQVWNSSFGNFKVTDEPIAALTQYIRAKVIFSQQDPDASRLFASEIIHGAPFLQDYLHSEFRLWVAEKVDVIQAWQAQGKIKSVNAYHLLFLIWSASQHYADFAVQVTAGMAKAQLTDDDFEQVINSLTDIILSGLGLNSKV